MRKVLCTWQRIWSFSWNPSKCLWICVYWFHVIKALCGQNAPRLLFQGKNPTLLYTWISSQVNFSLAFRKVFKFFWSELVLTFHFSYSYLHECVYICVCVSMYVYMCIHTHVFSPVEVLYESLHICIESFILTLKLNIFYFKC